MGFWTIVLAAVIAGVAVVAIIAAIKWAYRAVPAEISDVVNDQRVKTAAREQQRVEDEHVALVQNVLKRADVIKQDVVVAVEGRRPWIARMHPSGRTAIVYPDFMSYRRAGERGEHGGYNAHNGARPHPVREWGTDELKSWLHEHRHRTP